MCFRPSTPSKVINCPGCQKKLTLQVGNMATKCPFCGAQLEKVELKDEPPKE